MESGTCYKFTVTSAEEAASLIREKLGPDARVLSVRSVEGGGLSRLWSKPSLEVIAQVGPAAAPETVAEQDDEDESPAAAPELIATALPPRRSPAPRVDLSSLLRRAGMSELALGRLQAAPFWAEVEAQPLHRGLVDVGARIREMAETKWAGLGVRRAAFIGTAGSGRTTALCKWLGREIFRRARAGHVVTAEFEQPHAPGVLPVFCEAMGVPVARYPASTEPATPGGFVYLDLPGLSLRDPSANRPIAKLLDQEAIAERVLVLNAAYDHATLRSAYGAARDLGATHVVFTHLDEVPQWGRLWDYLLDGALEPLFLGTGPSLTGDCEEDVFGALVRRTLVADAGENLTFAPAAAPVRRSAVALPQ